MAVTLAELTSDIRDIASSGSDPNDFRITDEQIQFWIDEIRAILIVQAIQKRTTFSDTWIQTIPCVNLEQVDKSECCDVETGCLVLRSVQKIPDTIESDENNVILKVMGMDGTQITKTNQFRYKYKSFNKYTGKNKAWYIKDGYLYIINDQLLEKVAITGVFERPSDLANFQCQGEECWSEESPYPISNKMASTLVDIVVKTKVLPFMSFRTDSTNNSSNDPEIQPPSQKMS